ncbi:MAG: F0F1 ATP synthase subunit B [Rhodospirillaceae bacterium]|nr:F0F1 ATP synthase subunit B [Rhodospirillaceae bacterium]|tara:strand:- start:5050 stop:5538 length:489 start_codon:yes stop_codon:yes gene_type:complete
MAQLQTPEFWVAAGFLLLIAILAKPAWKAITTSLDDRADKIKASLDEAASLREEVQHLLADYQRKQREATREVDEMLANAQAEAERTAQEAAEALEESLKRREQLAMDKISQAEADAMQAVRNTAIDVAVAATQRILNEKLDDAAAAQLIDNAIAELPGKLH